jgi:hypothetical protein
MSTLLSYHTPIVAIYNCLCKGVRWSVNHAKNLQDLFRQLFNHPSTSSIDMYNNDVGKRFMK